MGSLNFRPLFFFNSIYCIFSCFTEGDCLILVPSLLDIVDLAGTPFCRITVKEEEKKTNVLRVMGQKKCNPSGVRYAQQGHPDSFQRVEAGGKPDSGMFQIIQIYSSFFSRLNSVISRVSYSIYTKKTV